MSESRKIDDKAPQKARYVFVERIRCPKCGSDRLRTTRSVAVDDAQRRTTVCRTCGARFFVVVE